MNGAGFEAPVSGPTTNFVGNHMTQGAIDLVQSDLKRRGEQQLRPPAAALPAPPGAQAVADAAPIDAPTVAVASAPRGPAAEAALLRRLRAAVRQSRRA